MSIWIPFAGTAVAGALAYVLWSEIVDEVRGREGTLLESAAPFRVLERYRELMLQADGERRREMQLRLRAFYPLAAVTLGCVCVLIVVAFQAVG